MRPWVPIMWTGRLAAIRRKSCVLACSQRGVAGSERNVAGGQQWWRTCSWGARDPVFGIDAGVITYDVTRRRRRRMAMDWMGDGQTRGRTCEQRSSADGRKTQLLFVSARHCRTARNIEAGVTEGSRPTLSIYLFIFLLFKKPRSVPFLTDIICVYK